MFGCHAVANVVVCTRIESRVSRGLGREQLNEPLKALVGYLDQGLLGTLVTIGAITEDGALSDAEKVASIRALLATRETQRLLQKNQVAMLKEALVSELSEDDYYRILESKSVWIQNRVGPILKALTFQGDPGARKLLDAIEHFKKGRRHRQNGARHFSGSHRSGGGQ